MNFAAKEDARQPLKAAVRDLHQVTRRILYADRDIIDNFNGAPYGGEAMKKFAPVIVKASATLDWVLDYGHYPYDPKVGMLGPFSEENYPWYKSPEELGAAMEQISAFIRADDYCSKGTIKEFDAAMVKANEAGIFDSAKVAAMTARQRP